MVAFIKMIGLLLLAVLSLSVHCDYTLVPADNRNIIFVGKSRAGKTTLIEVLKNKDHNPKKRKLLSETKRASMESFHMKSSDAQDLHFNVMDTPGLFEVANSLEDKRTNEVIVELIKACIDMEVTKAC